MKVLVLGATGFLGSAIVEALLREGHDVVAGVRRTGAARRRWPGLAALEIDFTRDRETERWRGRLAGVDAVVNAVGVFRGELGAIHDATPRAVFQACADAGVRVVQISALGASEAAVTDFLRSKNPADAFVLEHRLGVVLRPSLVFGLGGHSARGLLDLALAPVWPLPRGGAQIVQPVHVDDLADAVLRALDPAQPAAAIEAVGEPMTLAAYLGCLRRTLGRPPARVLALPLALARPLARLARRFGSLAGEDALAMLEASRTADPAPFARLLGRAPRRCERFLPPELAACLGRHWPARVDLRLLRLTLAAVWVGSGLVSLFVFPLESSWAMLERAGVPAGLAPALLIASAGLDLLFGALLLFAPRGHRAYRLQMAVVAFYSLVVAIALPEHLRHPFAPLLKNLPILAALWLLHRDEHGPWIT